jgi:hypothetical protein
MLLAVHTHESATVGFCVCCFWIVVAGRERKKCEQKKKKKRRAVYKKLSPVNWFDARDKGALVPKGQLLLALAFLPACFMC